MTHMLTYEELKLRVKELEKEIEKNRKTDQAIFPKTKEQSPSCIDFQQPYWIDDRYSIKDLIDLEFLETILSKFSAATKFAIGFYSHPDQTPLIHTGWRDICTKFHRATDKSEKHCKESNSFLTGQLKELKELNIKLCGNGLVCGATPVIIKGKHMASLATGQILFKEPDIKRFKKQAEMYGYDVDAYLDALQKVPIVTEEQFKSTLSFLSEMAVMIAELGLNNLNMKEKAQELKKEINERKHARKALQESKEKYGFLVNNLPGFVCKGYKDWSVEFFDNKIEPMLGYAVDEFNSKRIKWKDIIIKQDLEAAKESFVRALKTDKSYVREYRIRSKAKDICWIQERGYIVCDKKGEIEYVSCVFFNVTDRKQAENKLQESENRYRMLYQESKQKEKLYESLLKSTPDAVSIYNLKGEATYTNPAFSNIFGFTLEDIKGKLVPLVPESEMEKTTTSIKKVLKGEPVSGFETKRLTKDGRILDIILSSSCYNDHQGNKAGVVVFLRDVTEVKQTEKQLQQAQRMEAIGTLAGGIAHDFNNLLMGIQGRSSLMLLDKDSSHPDFGHLQGIEKHVQSAADLTNQLLAFARGGKYEVRTTDLNKLVENQSRMFSRTKKEISIEERYADNLWGVEIDRVQIEQVLLNLYVNAWQSMPEGGRLSIQTENVTLDANDTVPFKVRPGKYVKISVTDTGVGMDKETQQRIFDPFFTTKEMGRGTGLGLASAYGIIKNHGGFIYVYSEKGKGSTFNIYLPASEKEIIKETAILKGIMPGSETVLLVDDEDLIIDIGSQVLKKLGYSVLTAKSGKEAVEIYKKKKAHIDIIVLDMVMPDMAGGEVYDKLKKINPKVLVLLSSGYSITGQATEILNRGCNGFIQKPFNMKDLSIKMREILKDS